MLGVARPQWQRVAGREYMPQGASTGGAEREVWYFWHHEISYRYTEILLALLRQG